MRCWIGFVCVLALGLMGCSETSRTGGSGGIAGMVGNGSSAGEGGDGICDQADIENIYDCIDQPLCTPVLRSSSNPYTDFVYCSDLSQEACYESLEAPVDRPGFCYETTGGDVYQLFVHFCEVDDDCDEGYECGYPDEEFGMLKGECSLACVVECREDAHCPEGESCVDGRYCGDCSAISTGYCWDILESHCESM